MDYRARCIGDARGRSAKHHGSKDKEEDLPLQLMKWNNVEILVSIIIISISTGEKIDIVVDKRLRLAKEMKDFFACLISF